MKGIAIGTRRQAILFGALAVLLLFFVVKWSSKAKAPESAAPAASAVDEVSAVRPSRGGRRVAATPAADGARSTVIRRQSSSPKMHRSVSACGQPRPGAGRPGPSSSRS